MEYKIKMKTWLIKTAIAIAAVFAPAQGMILTALALCLIDLVTGVLAAKKQNIPITSAGLGRTVTKLVVYELAIMLAFLTGQYLTGPTIPCANIVAGLVGMTELLSCLENLNIIGGNDVLKSIVEKLSSKNDKR